MGSSEFCKKCKHSYKDHYHNEVIFVKEECIEELIDPNMKEEFEKSTKKLIWKKKLIFDGTISKAQRRIRK